MYVHRVLRPLVGTALAVAALHAQALTFNTFVSGSDLATQMSNTATIGFAYAGDKFVGSVYYGPNNNQLYSSDLTGGNVHAFGAPIPGFSGEVYVSSSLGIGGFGNRDVYAGSEAQGQVWRLSNDGSSQSLFVNGLGGGVRSIAFDPYGAYGFNMIVATNWGNVYRVDNAGTATLLANVGEDAEGLSFAPQGFGPYGTGTLFVASEGSGSLRAISPTGNVSTAISGVWGAEMVSFVPLNLGMSGNPVEGFYAAAYANDVQKANAADFMPYIGDAIVTSETGHGVIQVHWDGTQFVANNIGWFPAQPEDGIFVTADVIKPPVPEPGTYAMLLAGLGAIVTVARRRRNAR
jgi:sugar lactone lactonase YvrE